MWATTVSRCRTQYPYVENISDYGLRWRTYAETSKNEDTWWSVLWHCDAEYDTALRVLEGQWHGRHAPHTATPTTTHVSGTCTGTAAVELELQLAGQRLQRQQPGSGACNSLHFSPFVGGVLFLELSAPTTTSILPISSSLTDSAMYFCRPTTSSLKVPLTVSLGCYNCSSVPGAYWARQMRRSLKPA